MNGIKIKYSGSIANTVMFQKSGQDTVEVRAHSKFQTISGAVTK